MIAAAVRLAREADAAEGLLHPVPLLEAAQQVPCAPRVVAASFAEALGKAAICEDMTVVEPSNHCQSSFFRSVAIALDHAKELVEGGAANDFLQSVECRDIAAGEPDVLGIILMRARMAAYVELLEPKDKVPPRHPSMPTASLDS